MGSRSSLLLSEEPYTSSVRNQQLVGVEETDGTLSRGSEKCCTVCTEATYSGGDDRLKLRTIDWKSIEISMRRVSWHV